MSIFTRIEGWVIRIPNFHRFAPHGCCANWWRASKGTAVLEHRQMLDRVAKYLGEILALFIVCNAPTNRCSSEGDCVVVLDGGHTRFHTRKGHRIVCLLM